MEMALVALIIASASLFLSVCIIIGIVVLIILAAINN